jgi:hypothetical protein
LDGLEKNTKGWMDGKWSGDIFLLGSSSLANHGWLPQLLFFGKKFSNFLKAQKIIIIILNFLKTTLGALK